MAFMSWDNSLSVNVREIDLQHQKLISMINDFYEQIEKDPKKSLRTLIDSLVKYTQYHFATEEKYFEKYAYSGAGPHKEMHKKFTDKVCDIQKRLDRRELVVSFEITSFLKDWLISHIQETDKAYSKFFNEHGLS